jgi:hypothetical protein
MKIESNRPTLPSANAKRSAPGEAGFSPQTPQSSAAPSVKAAAPTLAAHGILALQGLEDPTARRARQIRRGHDSLDALEALRLGLLEGAAPGAVRTALDRLLRERDDSGDDALNAVINDIDVRVAVELAKLEQR